MAWGFLGWIALAPLLVLVRTQIRPSLVYLAAFVGGVVFFLPALSWMSVAHSSMVGAWIALVGLLSPCISRSPSASCACLDRRGWPLVVSLPLVWVALEFVRCHFLTGFPWYLLAHTQHNWLTMIQVTDLGGVFLVSLLVAAVNALAFDIAYQFVDVRRWFNLRELEVPQRYASVDVLNRGPFADWLFRRNLILECVAVMLLLSGTYAYGVACLRQDRFATGPTVCLLQSNIDQRLREGIGGMKDADQAFQTVESIYSEVVRGATTNIQPKPDLVIWPETSFPSPWIDIAADVPAENVPTDWRETPLHVRKNLHEIGGKFTKVPHLLGVNSYISEADGKKHHYNSALLLNAKGEVEPNRFDKIHRVPFGEYMPLKDWLPFLAALSPYEGDFRRQARREDDAVRDQEISLRRPDLLRGHRSVPGPALRRTTMPTGRRSISSSTSRTTAGSTAPRARGASRGQPISRDRVPASDGAGGQHGRLGGDRSEWPRHEAGVLRRFDCAAQGDRQAESAGVHLEGREWPRAELAACGLEAIQETANGDRGDRADRQPRQSLCDDGRRAADRLLGGSTRRRPRLDVCAASQAKPLMA